MSITREFLFENKHKITTIRDGDQIWFKGKDVATALGHQDTDKAVRNHVDVDDKKKVQQKATRRFGGVVKSMVILTSVRQVYTLWSSLRQLYAQEATTFGHHLIYTRLYISSKPSWHM